jgi:hypothetical protein
MINSISRSNASFGSVRFILGSAAKASDPNIPISECLNKSNDAEEKFVPLHNTLTNLGFHVDINYDTKSIGAECRIKANESMSKAQQDAADIAVHSAMTVSGLAEKISISGDNKKPDVKELTSNDPQVRSAIEIVNKRSWEKE